VKQVALVLMISLLVCSGYLGGCLTQQSQGGPNKVPIAFCDATPIDGYAPLTVNFIGLGNDPDGAVVSYHWDFGDGSTSAVQNPSHTFTNAGSYTVTLTVTDNNASVGTSTIHIYVTIPTNLRPSATISVNQTYGSAPLTLFFKGYGNDTDGFITSYLWSFDDNSTSTQPDTSHTFTQIGVYNVTLLVMDNQGGIDTSWVIIKCAPLHNLTPSGIQYICEQYGDLNHCIVSEGLVFTFVDDKDQVYEDLPGGTGDILGFIMIGIVQSLQLSVPSRRTIINPLQAFLDTNAGLILDANDVAFLMQHDENSTDQWCLTSIG
jgi:chitodextrinase